MLKNRGCRLEMQRSLDQPPTDRMRCRSWRRGTARAGEAQRLGERSAGRYDVGDLLIVRRLRSAMSQERLPVGRHAAPDPPGLTLFDDRPGLRHIPKEMSGQAADQPWQELSQHSERVREGDEDHLVSRAAEFAGLDDVAEVLLQVAPRDLDSPRLSAAPRGEQDHRGVGVVNRRPVRRGPEHVAGAVRPRQPDRGGLDAFRAPSRSKRVRAGPPAFPPAAPRGSLRPDRSRCGRLLRQPLASSRGEGPGRRCELSARGK